MTDTRLGPACSPTCIEQSGSINEHHGDCPRKEYVLSGQYSRDLEAASTDPGPVPTPAPVTMPNEYDAYRYLSPDTARTLHAVDTMRLTDNERRRMIEYMTGYDTDAVNAGLTFIAYTRRPRHPGPQS